MKKFAIFILVIFAILFTLQRVAAHLYLPKQGSTDVVIYTTTWCPYCDSLRNTLNSYGITFTDRDTEKSFHGLLGFIALNGRGVPVSVIGDQVVHGYDGQAITDALVSAGYEIPLTWPED